MGAIAALQVRDVRSAGGRGGGRGGSGGGGRVLVLVLGSGRVMCAGVEVGRMVWGG